MGHDLKMVERHCVVRRRNTKDCLEELSIGSSESLRWLVVRLQRGLEAETEDLEGRFVQTQEIERNGVWREGS